MADGLDLRFVKLSETDLAALRKISLETFAQSFYHLNTPDDFDNYVSHAFAEETLRRELLQQETSFYFVYDRSGVIAYFKLNFNIDPLQQPDLKSMELQRLYVFSTMQSVGLGAQIMDFIKALAINLNYRQIWLGVWEHNTKAIRFYERHGFIKTGEHPFLLGHDLQTDHIYSFIG